MKINLGDVAILAGIAIGGYLLYKAFRGVLDVGGAIAEPIKDVVGTVETMQGASGELSDVVGVPVGTDILTEPLPETILAYEGKALDYTLPVVDIVSQPTFIPDVVGQLITPKPVIKRKTIAEHEEEVLNENISIQKERLQQTLPFKLLQEKLGFNPLQR